MTVSRSRGARGGYVVLEALATLAIGALVLAGTASILSLVLGGADRTARAVDVLETAGRAMAAIERDLADTRRVRIPGEEGEPVYVFAGSPSTLTFVAAEKGDDGRRRPVLVRWESLAVEGQRGALRRSVAPFVPGAPLPAATRTDVIDTGASVIRFAFFSALPGGDGEALTDAWTDLGAMPSAVRLSRADPQKLTILSSVRAPLRIDADIGCISTTGGFCSLMPTGEVPKSDSGGAPAGDPGAAEPPPQEQQ